MILLCNKKREKKLKIQELRKNINNLYTYVNYPIYVNHIVVVDGMQGFICHSKPSLGPQVCFCLLAFINVMHHIH